MALIALAVVVEIAVIGFVVAVERDVIPLIPRAIARRRR